MADLEESQRVTIERLQKEIDVWKKKYSDQIKTDEEWERYIKKSREEAKEQAQSNLLGTWVDVGFTFNVGATLERVLELFASIVSKNKTIGFGNSIYRS